MNKNRKRQVWMRLMSVVLLVGALAMLSSCASSNGYHKRPPSGKFKCK